jgi:hypothetical protein
MFVFGFQMVLFSKPLERIENLPLVAAMYGNLPERAGPRFAYPQLSSLFDSLASLRSLALSYVLLSSRKSWG